MCEHTYDGSTQDMCSITGDCLVPLDGHRLGHSHHLPPGARQCSGRQSVLQPLLKDKLGNGKERGRGMSAFKAPSRAAAGTGHLAAHSLQALLPAGCRAHGSKGCSTSWLQLGSVLLTPLLSRLQSLPWD